jgi:transposase
MDNVSSHLNPRTREAIEARGRQIRFLPPYSPEYNPIELTFSLLKAWMRRHFKALRPQFQGDFGAFLRYAIEHSGCDKKAIEHFKYSAGGYQFEGDYEAFQQELADWVNGR